jgi:hypothetical protein
MTTVRDLIMDSLGMLGALGIGDTLSAEDAALCLRKLNQLAESINMDDRMVHAITRTVTALTPGTGTYTYGTGGTLNTARPTFIESASVLIGTNETGLYLFSASEWAAISDKSATGSYPVGAYFDGSAPLNNVILWPAPTSACSLVVYSWLAKDTFASVNTVLALPPGYEQFYEANLALNVAPFFHVDPTAVLLQMAVNSRSVIQSVNLRPSMLHCDSPGMPNDSQFSASNGYVE